MKKILLVFLCIALLQHCAESKYDPDFEGSELLRQHKSEQFQDDNELDKINNEDFETLYLNRRRNHNDNQRDDYNTRSDYNDRTLDYDKSKEFKTKSKEYNKKWEKYSDKKKTFYNDKKQEYKNKKNDYNEKWQKYSNEMKSSHNFDTKQETPEQLRSSEFDSQNSRSHKLKKYQNSLYLNEEQDLYIPRKEYSQKQNYHEKREVHAGKRYYNELANEITPKKHYADPPDHKDLIPMARYVLHNSDWASIGTISTVASIEGFPFTNVKSVVDGTIANSTGIPYFYMSPLDFTARDLAKNNRATVLVTLEETRYCEQKNYDAEDPRCTRLMLSGKMKKVKEGTTEYEFAKGALFERHPSMANFPKDHDWFVAKLKIVQIAMVDWFGGAKYIGVKDYLAYNYTNTELPQFSKHEQVGSTKSHV